MSGRRPSVESSARGLVKDLGLAGASDALALAERILTDPMALRHIGERAVPLLAEDESALPDVDALVDERIAELFADNLRALSSELDEAIPLDKLLKKRLRMGKETRRLLAFLSKRVGTPVPLSQLLLVNGLNNGTPRRLRELKTELGAFSIEVQGSGLSTTYTLQSREPDLDACARYWLLRNLRESRLSTDARLLALLAAYMPNPVSLENLLYVNPRRRGGRRARGRPKQAQSATARRVRALREKGWLIYSGQDEVVAGLRRDEYVMRNLERAPPYERLPTGVWDAVMTGSGGRCATCGWAPEDGASQGRKLLEVHHKQPQRARPEDVNDPSNLCVLCNVCHDGRHAGESG